ncbi:hypothetical protein INR49_032856 [Caranx melampygus]|nr:hypothetical protein INR49_032856 [Caranx melampygus]
MVVDTVTRDIRLEKLIWIQNGERKTQLTEIVSPTLSTGTLFDEKMVQTLHRRQIGFKIDLLIHRGHTKAVFPMEPTPRRTDRKAAAEELHVDSEMAFLHLDIKFNSPKNLLRADWVASSLQQMGVEVRAGGQVRSSQGLRGAGQARSRGGRSGPVQGGRSGPVQGRQRPLTVIPGGSPPPAPLTPPLPRICDDRPTAARRSCSSSQTAGCHELKRFNL